MSNSIKRVVEFENFRTIGVKALGDKTQELIINEFDLDDCKVVGGMVTLIGLNNCGKSNVLDGVNLLGTRLKDSDVPNFLEVPSNCKPKIRWSYVDHSGGNFVHFDNISNEYSVRLNGGENKVVKVEKYPEELTEEFKSSEVFLKHYNCKRIADVIDSDKIEVVGNELKRMQIVFRTLIYDHIETICKGLNLNVLGIRNLGFGGYSYNSYSDILTQEQYNDLKELEAMASNIGAHQLAGDYSSMIDNLQAVYKVVSEYSSKYHFSKIVEHIEEYANYMLDNLMNLHKRISGTGDIFDTIPLAKLPNIVKYDATKQFTSDDLALFGITVGNIEKSIDESKFFSKVFRKINVTSSKLKDIYTKEMKIRGVGDEFEKICENRLKEAARYFNKLYFNNEKNVYTFELNLESNNIKFIIRDNGKTVSLSDQSTGFKWFFNFFFNVLAVNDLKEGDIVILDEPATNLHAQSQIELAGMIRKFGVNNGITFIVSTHSPFFVNPDHLDEIRVIKKEKSTTSIENKFTIIDSNNVINPIKKSLFIKEFMLMDSIRTKVFVEGITDYNYLTAFKNVVSDGRYKEDFHFIPIQGLFSRNKEAIDAKKFEGLGKRYPNSVLLMDNDWAANKAISEIEKNNINISVIRLSEILSGTEQIEDLFMGDDKKYVCQKSFYKSSNFKNLLILNQDIVSKESKDNFEAILEKLSVS